MARLKQTYEQNGFYGIGLVHSAEPLNIGTLWRSAYILGASFIFTVGEKYQHQSSDVTRAWARIPLYHHATVESLIQNLPHGTRLVGVEMTPGAIGLNRYDHPAKAVYLLGNEQVGLSPGTLELCHETLALPGNFSLNVAVAGSIVMYDRVSKIPHALPRRGAD